MSYEKTTWATGDTITADKLNNLENGVVQSGSRALYGITKDDGMYVNITYAELEAMLESGHMPIMMMPKSENHKTFVPISIIELSNDDGYHVEVNILGDATVFEASSVDELLKLKVQDQW